ncbi:T. brucei spp.-specific protein [Trypanosoma brucei gambiense DAL972]|uniref:T. brucei spp.-specific protein n=1 Tax=Trypanosoma brucei gambiense (strain MHOM/CI/86/DAL972) TaxID=679716 RepID=C9ZL41_TRYB9|nr:T. brucei spp.-specific protein [Trypanosoma brucei gambiense DAL972]CBH10050.1 T. brucei spp.-specific protein [Trypanosoma brucei gambiense DAL972]|eukprot:XP_011772340.1 T. brucei spp.-specific protein [Trypanosoma brucei gambiense DAL972]
MRRWRSLSRRHVSQYDANSLMLVLLSLGSCACIAHSVCGCACVCVCVCVCVCGVIEGGEKGCRMFPCVYLSPFSHFEVYFRSFFLNTSSLPIFSYQLCIRLFLLKCLPFVCMRKNNLVTQAYILVYICVCAHVSCYFPVASLQRNGVRAHFFFSFSFSLSFFACLCLLYRVIPLLRILHY